MQEVQVASMCEVPKNKETRKDSVRILEQGDMDLQSMSRCREEILETLSWRCNYSG